MAKEKETKAKKSPKVAKKAESKAVKKVVKEKKVAKSEDADDEEAIESLDSIKKRLLKKAKADGNEIEQGEIQDAISFLDLEDKEVEDLINYFKENKINVISDNDEEGIEELEFDESDVSMDMDDEDVPDEKELQDISKLVIGDVKVNDSVKIYLKEIGKVPLLNAQQEIELAQRIIAGDEDAKQELINANLRLVISIAKRYAGRGM